MSLRVPLINWGLRDYGVDGQIGLEAQLETYVDKMVAVFAEVRRVLRKDGTLWLNLGDSYNGSGGAGGDYGPGGLKEGQPKYPGRRVGGLKPKDLCGIPWRVALALQADGWYLRSDIIWAKPNPMPSSVTDRPTTAHEYVFMLSKSPRYFYDADAIREPFADARMGNPGGGGHYVKHAYQGLGRENPQSGLARGEWTKGALYGGRNRRTVWTIPTRGYSEAHFATFPPALVEPCILAGTSPQACEACGAPWERVVERYDTGERQKMGDGWATHEGGHGSFHKDGREKGKREQPVMASRTIGWEPGCYCHDNDGSGECVVLDPFNGSGTTGMVALRHGRGYIGIELNPAYVEMSRRRIEQDSPLFNVV